MKKRAGAKNSTKNKEQTVINNFCFLNYLNESITAINGGDVSE